MVFDVFQDGLKRGAERLPFAPHKRYFYVEHPEEGWRVYLRACTFIHEQGAPFDPKRFIVVKTTGGDPAKKEWEPPKGQMEGKDTDPKKSIYDNLVENVHREVEEESKITKLVGLKHTGLVFQRRENDYPPNTYFQYHIFQAFTPVSELKKAAAEFEWIQGHMEEFMKIKKDKREKDAIAWYSPYHTKLMGRWSPKIVPMYLRLFS
jgi:hypothetical protein